MPERSQPCRYSFEEFQLLYESAEKVTDRRLAVNRWNYSLCTAILVAVTAMFSWGLANPAFVLVSLLAVLFLSLMAALLCTLWIGQIRDFKELNNAKFSVLNEMAPNICFGGAPEDLVSYCVFEREWNALQKAKAVQEVSNSDLIALKSSNVEYLLPKALRALFYAICVATIIFAAVNWRLVADSSLTLQVPSKTETVIPRQ